MDPRDSKLETVAGLNDTQLRHPVPVDTRDSDDLSVNSTEKMSTSLELHFDAKSEISTSEISSSEGPSTEGSSTEVSSSKASSTLEKGHAWEGYEEDYLPEKTQGKVIRNLRHIIFSIYRRLFGVVFIVNMAVLIATLVRGHTKAKHFGLVVVSNFFVAILMRQDHVINGFFHVFTAVPISWPLIIRTLCARVYSIGGIHSGTAVAGVVWLIPFLVQATKEVIRGQETSAATLAVTYCVLVLVLGMVIFAHPTLRVLYHDSFEQTHRFLGWTTVALIWVQVILLANDNKLPGQSLGYTLQRTPGLWMIAIMTGSIILPWLHLRKYPVRAEILSPHAMRLYFDYVTPTPGSFARISDSPLTEWHSFATIAEPGKTGYSMIISKAGDWTINKISNPPTKIWVRGVPTLGVMRIVPMFRRLVIVATGSGIAPCAPHILEAKVPIRLLWISPNVRKTFGDGLVDSLVRASPDAVIYDTREHGKPDIVKLTYRIWRDFNAEAVCIISNKALTDKVVYGLKTRGVPAFGAIWDS